MLTRLEAANQYIRAHKHKVTNRPHFHFSAEIGWLNDPNGFIYYGGEYHLFYQYNPYATQWDSMHWGHATTLDFVHWNYKPVALANDKAYDANGCFSGSAIEKDGKLYLMYTGHVDPNLLHEKDESQIVQTQCIAISQDGIHFEKHANNPVIGEKELPDNYLLCDFRDPKVWRHHDRYYCVLAVRNKQRRGEIIMFESTDLIEWSFHSSIYKTAAEQNSLLECPDFFHVDGKDVLLYSVMPCDPEFAEEVPHQVAYAIGKLNYEQGEFIVEHQGVIDEGMSFYAPQTTSGEQGERILIGWMQSWRQQELPANFAFNGMMSIPRQLNIKNNKLIQKPFLSTKEQFILNEHRELYLSANHELVMLNSQSGAIHLELSNDELQDNVIIVELQKNKDQSIRLEMNGINQSIAIASSYNDGQNNLLNVSMEEGLVLDLFIDLYSLELFINEGERVYTITSYETKGSISTISAARAIKLNNFESYYFEENR